MLNYIHPWLKNDGILFIKVPNAKFNLFKFWIIEKMLHRSSDLTFDSYEHVTHFTQATLTSMLRESGFKVIKIMIAKPIQIPVWHKYVGHYYQYPSPWCLDYKKQTGRSLLYLLSKIEFYLFGKSIGYLAPNIIAVANKI